MGVAIVNVKDNCNIFQDDSIVIKQGNSVLVVIGCNIKLLPDFVNITRYSTIPNSTT